MQRWLLARANRGNEGKNHKLVVRTDGGREQGDKEKPVPWWSTEMGRRASNTLRERRDAILRKATCSAETGTSYVGRNSVDQHEARAERRTP